MSVYILFLSSLCSISWGSLLSHPEKKMNVSIAKKAIPCINLKLFMFAIIPAWGVRASSK